MIPATPVSAQFKKQLLFSNLNTSIYTHSQQVSLILDTLH